jgi:hypothetical protein
MASDVHQLAALTHAGAVRAVAQCPSMEMLHCGPLLFLDDLVANERMRSHPGAPHTRLRTWPPHPERRARVDRW